VLQNTDALLARWQAARAWTTYAGRGIDRDAAIATLGPAFARRKASVDVIAPGRSLVIAVGTETGKVDIVAP